MYTQRKKGTKMVPLGYYNTPSLTTSVQCIRSVFAVSTAGTCTLHINSNSNWVCKGMGKGKQCRWGLIFYHLQHYTFCHSKKPAPIHLHVLIACGMGLLPQSTLRFWLRIWDTYHTKVPINNGFYMYVENCIEIDNMNMLEQLSHVPIHCLY